MQALLIAAMASGFTLAGGSLPLLRKEISHKHLTRMVAFSAGIILSAGMLEMLSESVEQIKNAAFLWLGVGFLTLYLLERITIIHSCHDEDCEREIEAETSNPVVALWGLGFHGMIDGFALAVSQEFNNTALSLMVAMGVLLHSFPTGMSLASLMLSGGLPKRLAWRVLALISSMAIVGAGLGMLIYHPAFEVALRSSKDAMLGAALAFSAGNFIYIATGDLLPEAHRNRSDYGVPLAVVLGFGINVGAFIFLGH